MAESPDKTAQLGQTPFSSGGDPQPDDVARAMAQALCRLAQIDPQLSAAKPAGRLFATLILLTCAGTLIATLMQLDR